MKIWLVRHGQTRLNALGVRHGQEHDPQLTPLGAAQAWTAGMRFTERTDLTILTSPLRRARETAALIALAAGVKLETIMCDARLTERPYDDGWLETCADAAIRAKRALTCIEHPHVIAVTHAGVIKGLMGISTPANGSVHTWRP